ncbi:nucleophile aminohydrolase [Tribonema minus]|uniref:Nucleophile aminohydrolase n=1 Tax=Tribonema minus TaxID=303371 RepID=A0A835YY71_9STRA|nr:nucleophile aminohydrolase [Tribonema minus]
MPSRMARHARMAVVVLHLAVGIVNWQRVLAVSHAIRQKPVSRTQRMYDMDAAVFSPEGNLYQVEYATKSVLRGSLAVGLVASDGVLLVATNQKQSPLLLPESVRKIVHVDGTIACAVSGLQPDGRLLVKQARAYLAHHDRLYEEVPSVDSIAAHLSNVCLLFNNYPEDPNEERKMHARPLGVGLLLAGWDDDGPALLFLNPAGSQGRWHAKAMGRDSEAADKLLRSLLGTRDMLHLETALPKVVKIFHDLLGDDFCTDRLEVTLLKRSAQGEPHLRLLSTQEIAQRVQMADPEVTDVLST